MQNASYYYNCRAPKNSLHCLILAIKDAKTKFPTFAAMQQKKYSLEKILTRLNIDALNEMQLASVAANEKHDNVILLADTGSGKTLAFLLPLLQLLEMRIKKQRP
jgi:superfamily II DNA/RNA helicase